MTDNENPSPEYLKAFNQSYLLEKEDPELSEKLAQVFEKRDDDASKGFVAGRKEYQKEKTKSKLPSWLKEDRLNSLDKKEILKKKDKDDIEKDF